MAIEVTSIQHDQDTTYIVVIIDTTDGKSYRSSFDSRDGISKMVESLKAQIAKKREGRDFIAEMKKQIEAELNRTAVRT